MKKLIILLLIFLVACSPITEQKEERIRVNNYSAPKKKTEPVEIEKDLGFSFTVLYDASENKMKNINGEWTKTNEMEQILTEWDVY